MRKLALGIGTAALLTAAAAAPAMAEVGFYAGPFGVGVGVGAPAYYDCGYNGYPCGYYALRAGTCMNNILENNLEPARSEAFYSAACGSASCCCGSSLWPRSQSWNRSR